MLVAAVGPGILVEAVDVAAPFLVDDVLNPLWQHYLSWQPAATASAQQTLAPPEQQQGQQVAGDEEDLTVGVPPSKNVSK